MRTVSVVIPCFNVADYLADCLDSVIRQSHVPLEIICVDDASSDETPSILKDCRLRYPGRLTVLRNSANSGAPFSRNVGLRSARGDYIQYLDADDLLLPGKLARQVSLVGKEAAPVLVAGSFVRRRTDGLTVERRVEEVKPLQALITSGLGITSANLWPRYRLIDAKGWDESLGSSQEYNLMFRLLKRGIPVVFDREMLTVIRERPSGSITHRDPSANCRRFIDLRLQILRHVRESGGDDVIEKVALQVIFEWIHFLYLHDSDAARRLYEIHIRGKYAPRSSELLTRRYVFFYRLLGFDLAEKIRTRLSAVLS